jgi:3-methyl-2-oxobutanoate hydroxymethyltransferase
MAEGRMRPAELTRFKQSGRAITMLTAWDGLSAALVEEAGADVVLVGDSLAMVVLGHETTLPVTLEHMLHHSQAVCRGLSKPLADRPLVVCDLPFLSYQCGLDRAVAAAGTILKESDVAGIKLEGGEPEIVAVVDRLVRMGIPVMGHLGLTPQAVHRLGYRRQAIDPRSQDKLHRQAQALQDAGCFSLVLEHVPSELAGRLRRTLSIPVIGIGAGPDCDGQVSVTADLLGLTPSQPPFTPARMQGRELSISALKSWLMEQRDQGATPTTPPPPPATDC